MHENIEHLRGRITLHEADITSAERINEIFDKTLPNSVLYEGLNRSLITKNTKYRLTRIY